MKDTKRPKAVMARLLTKVAQAGAVGELKFRRTLLVNEMKQIDLMDRKGRSASLKRKKVGRTRASGTSGSPRASPERL